MPPTYAELRCHTNFSFLHGASSADDLVERAVELGLSGLAVTDHDGLYGVVRFTTAAQEAGLRPILGVEIELVDPAVADPDGVVVPARRGPRRGRSVVVPRLEPAEGLPARPRPERARLPGHRRTVKEDLRGIGTRQRGPHLVLLARDAAGYRSLCRLVSRANLQGTKRVPRFEHALLAEHAEGVVALSGGRDGEIGRRLLVGDREGAKAAAERFARLFGRGDSAAGAGFFLELTHHLLPDDDWLVRETAALAAELGLPVVVTNDVHYSKPGDRELHDVLTAIAHGRTLDTLADLRRPDAESYLKSEAELRALPPGEPSFEPVDPRTSNAWAEGLRTAGEVAASCSVDLGFEQYRFPGFPVPRGETPFSHLSELCWEGARRRYHPLTSAVVNRLAHELDVIERAGLAEFFLICWDLMRFAKAQGIPAQGRGSATSSIVSYTLGISRVEPIAHNLLFERFINEGRTTYPDVDIDFSSERREEVIQYIYRRYGPEHTGMVCNLVTYRARSAVREIGYALGFPRPLVDRVAKALETYDSVMVRRDLEADGGFAEFFRRPGEGLPTEAPAAQHAEAHGLVDGMGQLNKRVPLIGKVPPWRQPPKPADPNAPRPFAWLAEAPGHDLPASFPPAPLPPARLPPARLPPAPLPPGSSPMPTPGAFLTERSAEGGSAAEPSLDIVPPPVWSGTSPVPGNGRREVSDVHSLTNAPPTRIGEKRRPPGGDSVARLASDFVARLAGSATSHIADDPAHRPDLDPVTPSAWSLATQGDEIRPASATSSPLLAGRPSASGVPVRSADGVDGARGDPTLLPRDPNAPASSHTAHAVGIARVKGGEAGDEGVAAGDEGVAAGDEGVAAGDEGVEVGADVVQGPSRSGMWEAAPNSPPSVRAGGRTDDEGGPGDTPASVAWLRAGRGTGYGAGRETGPRPAEGNIRGGIGTDRLGRPDPHSSVARVEPEPAPQPRGGSTAAMSDWERWLEFCARIDGFPRHLSIHSGGMLVTRAPLIDIAPLERATMKDRVVVQFDKRDVEELKLIKLDLLGLGMLAAIDETVQLIEHDCGTCVVLDSIPEQVPEVFDMLRAADTVGVFQVESRAQMQTLPKSRPGSLDDLVVEVAIIRPGPIQGNAVHPYLRRKQGLEPVTYLHPSLEPVLRDSMGVILYQEQVMRIAIEVAGFSPAESDGFRRAMGTWRSTREMEKLHQRFHDGCLRQPGMTEEIAEELFRQVAAFASFGFAKSHAAAFARTAYESAFLKLFYPAQFLVGLINAQPMGFYPVEVLVNDAKRHGVAVLPVDLNTSGYRTTTEWVGRPGWALAGAAGDDGSSDDEIAHPGEPLPEGSGIEARPRPVRSAACVMPGAAARDRWAAESAVGWGVRLGLGLVKGIGEQHEELLDRERERGPYRSLADVVERTGLPEETIERLIRVGALDSLGRPRRELLWQLREVAGSARGRVDGKALRTAARAGGRRSKAAGRPLDLRLPATDAPDLPPISEPERLGDAYAVVGLDARRQAVSLFRDALERLGAVPNAALAERRPGPVRIGGLVVTRQHPMTARGTVFLALEDETGMVNVTLWPDTWARLRGVVRRHALLLVDGDLQRDASVINIVAREVVPLTTAAESVDGPESPSGVRQLGYAGMRRLG